MKNYQNINNKIALFVTFILVVLTAFIMSKIIWQVLKEDKYLSNINQLTTNKTNNNVVNLPINLFGNLNLQTKKAYKNVKKTNLNLKLMGIIKQKKLSLAVIKSNYGKEMIYRIGDNIDKTTKLKEINSKYIIIDNNGKDEKLVIKQDFLNKNYNKNRDSNKSKKIISNSSSNKNNPVTITKSEKSKLKDYLRQLPTNPQKLLSVITIVPHMTPVGMQGFIVSPGRNKTLFYKLGFKPNDIILSVNDIVFNDISQTVDLRDKLANERNFNLVIKRKDNITSLYIELD